MSSRAAPRSGPSVAARGRGRIVALAGRVKPDASTATRWGARSAARTDDLGAVVWLGRGWWLEGGGVAVVLAVMYERVLSVRVRRCRWGGAAASPSGCPRNRMTAA